MPHALKMRWRWRALGLFCASGCPRPKLGASCDHGCRPWHVRQRVSANRYDLGMFEGTAADSCASGICTVYAPSSRRCIHARQDVDHPTSTASALPISVPGCARVHVVEPRRARIPGLSIVDGPLRRGLSKSCVYFIVGKGNENLVLFTARNCPW